MKIHCPYCLSAKIITLDYGRKVGGYRKASALNDLLEGGLP